MIFRKAMLFVALTYLASWPLAFCFFGLGGSITSPLYALFGGLYMFIPAGSAVVVQKLFYKQSIKELGITFRLNKWVLVAWLLPVVLVLAATAGSTLLPGTSFSSGLPAISEQLHLVLPPSEAAAVQDELEQLGGMLPLLLVGSILLGALVAGPTLNAIVSFGEELGWRGLLLQELLSIGFWKSSFAIGVIWGLWHLPLILHGHNYPDHPLGGVFMMILFTTLLSPLFSFLRIKTESVIAPSVAHGVLNATAGAAVFVKGGSDLSVGITGVPGLILLAITNLVLFVYFHWKTDYVEENPLPKPA